MSTRSFVGKIDNGKFKARYIHYDGYPTYMLETIVSLARRDGVEEMLDTLTNKHYEWFSLNYNQPDISSVTPDENAQWETAEKQAALFAPGGIYSDGRLASVTGYGVAYTTVDNQSSESDWITGEIDKSNKVEVSDSWCEWGYLFDGDDIIILATDYQGYFYYVTRVNIREKFDSAEIEDMVIV